MNYYPELTTGVAVFMAVFATFLWGSWFVSLKFIKDFPLDGFYVVLFITSFIFVWLVGLIVDGGGLLGNIQEVFKTDPSRVLVSLACGVAYVFGMRISLYVMQTIGLSLTQPISASISIIIGISVSTLIGGIPEHYNIPRLVYAAVMFLGAVVSAMMAARYRVNPQDTSGRIAVVSFTMSDMWKAVGWIGLAAIFSPAYSLGLSYGLKSITQPNGLAVLPYMAMLVTGAFFGSMILSGGILTYRKQWGTVIRAPFTIHRWGIMSGLAHYGGNIIHTYSTAFLSSAVTWPLAITMGLWTQMWGLAFGEFKGSPRKAYVFLFSAIILYIIGGTISASLAF
jgi:hypothetical protein